MPFEGHSASVAANSSSRYALRSPVALIIKSTCIFFCMDFERPRKYLPLTLPTTLSYILVCILNYYGILPYPAFLVASGSRKWWWLSLITYYRHTRLSFIYINFAHHLPSLSVPWNVLCTSSLFTYQWVSSNVLRMSFSRDYVPPTT